jgi:mono/diheme cytochrome c family protein
MKTKTAAPPARWVGVLALAAFVTAHWLGCQARSHEVQPAKHDTRRESEEVEAATWLRVEDAWLSEIGTGPEQTSSVCGNSAQDRIKDALCADPAPKINGIEDLYEALGLVGSARSIAATTHSLGLSTRTVTPANPRAFVFTNTAHYPQPTPLDTFAVVTFTRGEQLVELVALDMATYDWNFYLLQFNQACNETRCTPEDLLTNRVEQDWKSWTLYADTDLVDTPLDCLSCHLPFGEGTHKLLRMRQLSDPWIHWGDFRGVNESANCSQDGPKTAPKREIPGEGLDVLLALEGADGKLAGLNVAELHAAKTGRDFAGFIVNSRLAVNDSPYGPNYPQGELELDSARILCELLDNDTSKVWEQYRTELTGRGLPVAYYGTDVLAAEARRELTADRADLLERHGHEAAFDVASGWMDPGVAEAVGLVPRPTDTAEQILRQMCVRCHGSETPTELRRSNFNAQMIGRIDPVTAHAIRRRIHLPATSPELMPPRRAGVLTESAIARIETYLAEHCSDPHPGACE